MLLLILQKQEFVLFLHFLYFESLTGFLGRFFFWIFCVCQMWIVFRFRLKKNSIRIYTPSTIVRNLQELIIRNETTKLMSMMGF